MSNAGRPLMVVLGLLLSCGLATSVEELGLFGLLNSCKFRRSMNSNICCEDLQCPSHSCCELYLVYGGFSAQGKCVPRDPNTMLCSRRRQCRGPRDCGRGECCRLEWKRQRLGVCDRLGQHGHVCTRKPIFVQGLPVLCPCDNGKPCVGSYYNVKARSRRSRPRRFHRRENCFSGTCFSPTQPPPRTTTTMTTTRTPTATTTPTTTTSPTSTTTLPTTTTSGPCALCPDNVNFCCLNDMCRIRPSLGDECGANSCPCKDNTTCSDPTSPTNSGLCLSPTTAPPSTTTTTSSLKPTTSTTMVIPTTTTTKTTTEIPTIFATTQSAVRTTTLPRTTTTSPTTTTSAETTTTSILTTTNIPTTTTSVPETTTKTSTTATTQPETTSSVPITTTTIIPLTTTPTPTTPTLATTTSTVTTTPTTTTVPTTTTTTPSTSTEPTTSTTKPTPTTSTEVTTTSTESTTTSTTAVPTSTSAPTTSSVATTTSTESSTTTASPTTTTTPSAPTTTTTEGPCSRCQDERYFCCLNDRCRIRPSLGQECGDETCRCQGTSQCSVPLSPDAKGSCQDETNFLDG